MTGIQGRRFSEQEIAKIRRFLTETEMTISEIATRMGCSKGPVAQINRRFDIRHYNGKRSVWEVGTAVTTVSTQP
jgi:hypothetical protein